MTRQSTNDQMLRSVMTTNDFMTINDPRKEK